MSRQYSNRPFIPPRRRVSLQMCDFVSYPTSQTSDTSSNSSAWQLTDPLSCIHQQPTSSEPSSHSTQNNVAYFQYPSHQHILESPLLASNQETNNNNNNNNNQVVHHLNELHPSYHFHHLQSNEREQPRSSLPLSLVTAAATTTATAPHHRHYRLENPSAAAFTRHPPWFDDESEDDHGTIQRSSRNNNHTKRQRSSAVSTPTSQSSQSYQHPERKRSRHEGINDENARANYHSQENVLQQQQQQQQQNRSSSHHPHHYQPYPSYRHVQPQPVPLPRTSYNDNVPSLARSFDQRTQAIQRNRNEHSQEINNTNVHYGPHHHTVQPPLPTQPRNIYHSSNHRSSLLESPPVALPHRQPIPPPPPPPPPRSYTQQQNHQQQHQRSGITIEPVPQRAPLFHRTSMTAHLHQRPSTFLTDLLHRVIDAHAASYSDNHVHYHHHHHHHPPSASIDLIAYAWMSPGHDIFSLPAAFSIQFGDFFDLTMSDETPVVGLTDSELERLPTMIFTKSCTNIEDDDKCAVCLSEYIGGEKLKRLRCKHFFHSECIDPWLKTSTRCPICRGEQTS
ncbi:unnamed protein product [Rotaria sp. Silwood2]|nr:unnamed protein product [Rotaria sp. Silwood2]CAF3123550.1 unnamed protein product [Rotaria sp. Silwood2]CAF4085528.1 unnamed protein product [Rotaria sp. Silwood2]CAF4402872.1 unnamed protein product [Rotaria sp. Silwood2]